MKTLKYSFIMLIMFSFIMVFLNPSTTFAARRKSTIGVGMPFPNFILSTLHNPQFINYLGLKTQDKQFPLNHINAKVLLIEFFNTHCPHCQKQAPIYNKLFDKLAKCADDCDQIKMVAIAVGNSVKEVDDFRQRYMIEYPLFADPHFAMWSAIGGKASPLTILVYQGDGEDSAVVCSTHVGTQKNYRKTYSELKELLETSPTQRQAMIETAKKTRPQPPKPNSEEALRSEVYFSLRQLGRVVGLKKIDLPDYDHLYTARVFHDKKSQRLYAHIIERETACDVCHDVKFICLFDKSGNIIDIVGLKLSKKGNKPWDSDDIKFLKQRLIGRNLSQPQPFDATVDAITSATISSATIFNSIAEEQDLLHELNLRQPR